MNLMTRRARSALSTLACLAWGAALGAGLSPIPGSSRPDAYGRAGQPLTLTVPEVEGRTVNINGVPAIIQSDQVSIDLPARTPPGRTVVRFANVGDGTVLATREIDVLPPAAAADPALDRRLQVLLNPNLSPDRVRAIMGSLTALGVVKSQETLPRAAGNVPSPCGGTLADVELKPGLALEKALNVLLGTGANDIWYPDPISTWWYPSQQVPAAPEPLKQVAAPRTPSFNYTPMPILPRNALGIGSKPTLQTGKGITIAVLDTGFSPSIDSRNELTGRVNPAMNALAPFHPVNTFQAADTLDFWEGHGTQVAILAAGSQHGIATQARVLPVKVCAAGADGRANCNTRDVLRGICMALSQVPANKLVLNLSLGGSTPTSGIHAVLNWAQTQGTVVVAAGGNQGERGSPKEYPAAFAQGVGSQAALPLMAVASVTPVRGNSWGYSAFSTRGTYLNVSAPGEALDIGHAFMYSGTSFAAPLVAGAAALVKSTNPNTPPTVVKAFMLTPTRTKSFAGIQPMLDLSGY